MTLSDHFIEEENKRLKLKVKHLEERCEFYKNLIKTTQLKNCYTCKFIEVCGNDYNCKKRDNNDDKMQIAGYRASTMKRCYVSKI